MVYTLYMDSLEQLVCVCTFHTVVCICPPLPLPSAGLRICYQGSKGSVWSYMYMNISHLFLVLVLWNKLLSWIRSQQLVGDLLPRDLFVSMNSVQPTPTTGSGYIVSALAIAIVVAMSLETAAAVQASLLLRCGDIETNPGPITREGEMSVVRCNIRF